MKEKGFTLIELLAVIVILSVILLITIPRVYNIMRNSKEKSFLISEKNYIRAAEQAIYNESLNGKFSSDECIVQLDGNLLCDGEKLVINVSGDRPREGTLLIGEKEVKEVLNLRYEGLDDYINEIEQEIYIKEDYTPIPNLMNDTLVPVIYDGDNWIITDRYSKWYDYDKQEWANAVILTEEVKDTKQVGDTVTVEGKKTDIIGMFVFIPRYEYTIGNTYGVQLEGGNKPSQATPGAIDIKFVNEKEEKKYGKATYIGNKPKEWYTHPAFTFGDEELSGIWVGKFEPSASENSICYTTSNLNDCKGIFPYTIPNSKTLRISDLNFQIETTKNLEQYVNGDSHVAKNSEWAAVAYLSQSKYGKYGNSAYEGEEKQVYQNNSSSYYTGRSSGASAVNLGYAEADPLIACNEYGFYTYDGYVIDKETGDTTNARDLTKISSTTGNITGIYDMVGGSSETVMAHFKGISWTLNHELEEKYYDLYDYTDISKACGGNVCYGHALSETMHWYGDGLVLGESLVHQKNGNGESCQNIWYAGVFETWNGMGRSFRIVIS